MYTVAFVVLNIWLVGDPACFCKYVIPYTVKLSPHDVFVYFLMVFMKYKLAI
jgi:hypothetical protein